MDGPLIVAIVGVVVVLLVVVVVVRATCVVPNERARVVERFGRYLRTLSPGLTLLVPFVDRAGPVIDLREQVMSVPSPHDRLVRLYFQVVDARAATYEVENYPRALERLVTSTLPTVGGSADPAEALRAGLDKTTAAWGVRVNRVEITHSG